ncbi:MAG: hypothetical protein LBB61_04345, partial [Treponema sp.]|jgi:hypothetical protein|nr:hypothetical protein [Treponema sp.]
MGVLGVGWEGKAAGIRRGYVLLIRQGSKRIMTRMELEKTAAGDREESRKMEHGGTRGTCRAGEGRLPPETIGTPPKGKRVHPWEYAGETKFRMEWNRINGGMRMKTIVYALKNMRNIKNKTLFSLLG